MKSYVLLKEDNYITQEVGELRLEIVEKLGLEVKERRIVLYPGGIKHMKNRHYRAYKSYFKKIPDIIQNPDYAGISLSEERCIELVKKYDAYVLVAIKWDDQGRLFVSSMYMMDDNRIENRVLYGKLLSVPKTSTRQKMQKYRNNRSMRR
ncbi:MAG: PBECR2 nuclease fold domain-containing protein [Cellulosilyticaceae bacterium]